MTGAPALPAPAPVGLPAKFDTARRFRAEAMTDFERVRLWGEAEAVEAAAALLACTVAVRTAKVITFPLESVITLDRNTQ